MATITFVNPNFDIPTRYGHEWLNQLMIFAKNKGYSFDNLQFEQANREQVEASLSVPGNTFLIGQGHGINSTYFGQNVKPLITSGVNDFIVKDKIVYLLTCNVGANLGPSMIKSGARAFIGYKESFSFNVSYPYDPTNDKRAKPFMEASNAIAKKLLSRGTVKQAYVEGINVFTKWINHYYNSTDPMASLILANLMHDRSVLIAIGQNVKLETPQEQIVPEAPGQKIYDHPLFWAAAAAALLLL